MNYILLLPSITVSVMIAVCYPADVGSAFIVVLCPTGSSRAQRCAAPDESSEEQKPALPGPSFADGNSQPSG